MGFKEFKELLNSTDDRLSLFADVENIRKHELTVKELFELVKSSLSDEEKLKLFDYSHFKKLNAQIRAGMVNLISDENIRLQILNGGDFASDFQYGPIMRVIQELSDIGKQQVLRNDNITSKLDKYKVFDIIIGLSDAGKQAILQDDEFMKKHEIDGYGIQKIISSFSEEAKIEVLLNNEFVIDRLHLENFRITELIKEVEQENAKNNILNNYSLENSSRVGIISTYSDEGKINSILGDTALGKYNRIDVLKLLDIDNLSQFVKEHKEFCEENDIKIYEIAKSLDVEKQLALVSNLENMGLTLREKREILAMLKPETKEKIDTSKLPEEYKTAIDLKLANGGNELVLDFDRNLEDYRGLERLLRVKPEEYTVEQRAKIMQLCDICPDLEIISTMYSSVECVSTAREYKEGEAWINSVINSLNPEYSKAQKLAIIDNAIGKRISYSPDFDTEVSDVNDCRALWKVISSGYGVCNGISQVEQYMLNRVGIESEFISAGIHAFLKVKDIELSLSNGEVVRGNTIVDPTWDLSNHKFGGRPDSFCMSYEVARSCDINSEGTDLKCHENDEALQDATLNLDEQSVRQLFASVGLADREGQFPIGYIVDKSKKIHEICRNYPETDISKQFLLLSKVCPDFALCQNESMIMLKDILLNDENLAFNKCVVNRVYDREDPSKRPVMYVYIDSDELGKKFFFADKDKGQFIELPQEEFVSRFECYEMDLQKSNGVRPWETREQQRENTDLSRSSGNIVAKEEEER